MKKKNASKKYYRAYASPMLNLDAAKAMPAIGGMLAQQARQELEKGCELFPESVKAKVRKLYECADAKRTQRQVDAATKVDRQTAAQVRTRPGCYTRRQSRWPSAVDCDSCERSDLRFPPPRL